jgi:hypothetical protein
LEDETMLKEMLIDFMADYGHDFTLCQAEAVCVEVVRYHALGGTYEHRRTLKHLTDADMAKLVEKKVTWRFRRSALTKGLWRALNMVVCNGKSVEDAAAIHQVSEEDLVYELDRLNELLRERMRAKAAKDKWQFNPINKKDYTRLAAKLQPFAKKLVTSRLAFLAKYDRGLCMEDLVNELWVEGCRVLQIRWHFPRESSRLNLARRAMTNRSVDLIKFHTDPKRAKIVGVITPDAEREEEWGSHQQLYERHMTTLSLDRPTASLDSREDCRTLHNLCADTSMEDAQDERASIEALEEDLPKKYHALIRIVAGCEIPSAFEEYIAANYPQSLEKMTLEQVRPAHWGDKRKPRDEDFDYRINYGRLFQLACNWLGLKETTVRRRVGPRLKRLMAEQASAPVYPVYAQS